MSRNTPGDTWDSANTKCRDENEMGTAGDMATIMNLAENRWLADKVK